MPKAQIIIKGGRVNPGESEMEAARARGQDIGVFVVIDGKRTLLPVRSLVLRCDNRRAIATVELFVDEVELTSIEAQIMGI